MGSSKWRGAAFTLMEFVLGLGLAAVLLLTLLLLGASALSSDAKASQSQIASALAESQLDLLRAEVTGRQALARQAFWNAPDGPYTGPGSQPSHHSNRTEYTFGYTLRTVCGHDGASLGVIGNRLKQVDIEIGWWEGEKGRPGYGRTTLARTRLYREADVR